jgi:hypothetical protein
MSPHCIMKEVQALSLAARQHVHDFCVRQAICCRVNAALGYEVAQATASTVGLPIAEVGSSSCVRGTESCCASGLVCHGIAMHKSRDMCVAPHSFVAE